ncbi:MAG: double zinc ribbon domain-containing protein [Treponema sp.]|nr:double zinc ribbon domain-containing protein [Treponema sp.]
MNLLYTALSRWRETLREALFPQGCALCGRALYKTAGRAGNENALYGLCGSCREILVVPRAGRGRCSICGKPLISESGTCLPCRNGPARSFDRVISLFPYAGKYQKILSAYKFKKHLSLGNFFAEKLRQGLDMLLDSLENSTMNTALFGWTPVPFRSEKIKQKGWDQIEYLARLLESSKNKNSIPVRRCLLRLPSESQKELNRENRLQNLKGKIIVTNSTAVSRMVPRTAILFDDVYTTGATLDACATALKTGGAERVYGICLCYD